MDLAKHTYLNNITLASFHGQKPKHNGLNCAGQKYAWMMSDTEENYRRMIEIPEHRKYFAEQGWDQPDAISYRINSEGFRGDEFNGDFGLVSLGCSFTMGVGLPEHHVWPWRVGQALGLKVANLAWGGNAADTCLRMAVYWIPRLQPKLVIVLLPPPDRFEIFLDQEYANSVRMNASDVEVIMPQTDIQMFHSNDLVKHYWLNHANSYYNRLRNSLAIKQVCTENHVPCMVYCSWEAFGKSREELGYARDYMHAGAVGHEILATRMINDWNEIQHS